MTAAQLLKSVPLFACLSDADIDHLVESTRVEVFSAKDHIIKRGAGRDMLYIIATGLAKVHSTTEGGIEVTLAVLGPGDYFGELSVLDQRTRSANVSAIAYTECLVLAGAALQETILQHKQIGWALLQHLAKLVRDQNTSIEALASRDVPGRVAVLLLRLCEQHGQPWRETDRRKPTRDGVRIDVPLTKTDIATFVGSTREHVSRVMVSFTRSGCITTDSL